MDNRHVCSVLALAFLAACRTPELPSVEAPSPPELPAMIGLPSAFTGSPVRVATLDGGIVVEILAEGEGERATTGKLVVFEYDGYHAHTGEPLVGYRKRMIVGDEFGNPIDAALHLMIAEQQAGMRARVFVPTTFVDASKPARAPAVGDLWLTVTIEQVREYPEIVGFDAFSGEPIASKILDDGIEIHDYALGEGPAAVDGDLVEFVMIAGTMGDNVYLHNPHEVAHSLTLGASADGFPRGMLEDARVGMLRAIVIPHRDTKEPDQPSLDAEFVHYLQITWIGTE